MNGSTIIPSTGDNVQRWSTLGRRRGKQEQEEIRLDFPKQLVISLEGNEKIVDELSFVMALSFHKKKSLKAIRHLERFCFVCKEKQSRGHVQ